MMVIVKKVANYKLCWMASVCIYRNCKLCFVQQRARRKVQW